MSVLSSVVSLDSLNEFQCVESHRVRSRLRLQGVREFHRVESHRSKLRLQGTRRVVGCYENSRQKIYIEPKELI